MIAGSTLRYEPGWRTKMVINGFGAVCTFIVMIVFAVTKFRDGAWIVVLLIPTLVVDLLPHPSVTTDTWPPSSRWSTMAQRRATSRQRVILADRRRPPRLDGRAGLRQGAVRRCYRGVRFDRSGGGGQDPQEVGDVGRGCQAGRARFALSAAGRAAAGLYREDRRAAAQPNETITIVVPQFVPKHFWENLLHSQTALILRMALLFKPGIVITEVPYHID